MNNFINLKNNEMMHFGECILKLQCFEDFLHQIDVTYGFYHDHETGRDHIVIKCKGNRCALIVEFINGKFESIYKTAYMYDSKNHCAFEYWLGRVLLEHFRPARCSGLTIYWGKNEMEVKDKD